MASRRVVIATVLAAIAFSLSVFGIVGASTIAGMSGHAGLAASHLGGLSSSHVPGLVALAASIGAFVICLRERSFMVAGLLIGAGIAYSVHLGPYLGDHSAITLYGPVIGVISGHVILALGIISAIGSIRTPLAKPAS